MLADIILFNKSTAMQRGLYSTTIFFVTVVKMLLLCRVAELHPIFIRFYSKFFVSEFLHRSLTFEQ